MMEIAAESHFPAAGAASGTQRSQPSAIIKRNARGHVLVVEDDLIIADLIDQILKFEGFVVSHVVDGQSAVDFVGLERPDLILMDLMLPVMSGIEASRLIKGSDHAATASIPIVAMSAGVNLRAAATGLPVDGVLAKPFDIDELLATVNIHLKIDGLPTDD